MSERIWPVPEYSHETWREFASDVSGKRNAGKRPPEPGSLEEARAINPEVAATVESLVRARVAREYEDKVWLLKKDQDRARGAQKPRIPRLKPHTIPAYIAAVARELQAGKLTPAQGNGLLYAAQLLVSAMRIQAPPPPTPTRVGFDAAHHTERTENECNPKQRSQRSRPARTGPQAYRASKRSGCSALR